MSRPSTTSPATLTWADEVEEILGGDLTAALAYNLPHGGVALAIVAPLGLQDRAAGTVAFTTSLGFGRKLDRIAYDNRVALAFHARDHGYSEQAGFVLIQGRAQVTEIGERLHPKLLAQSERYLGPMPSGRLWRWWLNAYMAQRVLVTITADRITLSGGQPGQMLVTGRPAAPPPPPQAKPAAGQAQQSQRGQRRTLERIAAMPHRLLSYQDGDGYPVIMAAGEVTADADGAILHAGLLPAGGRRAALLGHRYRPQLIGLETRLAIGWLDVPGGASAARLTPRSCTGFSAPASKTLLLASNGYLSRRGVKRRRSEGGHPAPPRVDGARRRPCRP